MNGIYDKTRKLNQKNQTALHIAAKNNLREMGQLLISKGADINAKDIFYPNIVILFFIKLI